MSAALPASLIWSSAAAEVYAVNLDRYSGAIILSPDERARAESMRSAVERRRFAAHRSVRRALLAAKLGVDPLDLQFEIDPNGKPRVFGGGLHFSVSRSERFGLVAISDRFDLGADIQAPAGRKTLMQGLKHYLSPDESRAVVLSGRESDLWLLRLWTRKEAAAKALGIGLDGLLKELNALDDEAEWLGCRIRFEDLPAVGRCAACLAVKTELGVKIKA